MSIVKFGEDGSSIYMYPTAGGKVECCGCPLVPRKWGSMTLDGYGDAIDHVKSHISAGHSVPSFVIPELVARRAQTRE